MRRRAFVLFACLLMSFSVRAQQPPENFQWLNLNDDRKVLPLVTKALKPYSFTALREVGLFYDQALAVVSERKDGAALPGEDHVTVYNINLGSGKVEPIFSGYDVRWVAWQPLAAGGDQELIATYSDCVNCAETLSLVSFHISRHSHQWTARWGNETPAPLASRAENTQYVYALLNQPQGGSAVAAWTHTETPGAPHPKSRAKKSSAGQKDALPEDRVYLYVPDAQSDMGLAQPVGEKDAPELEKRLCLIEEGNPLHGGQGSPVCAKLQEEQRASARKPTTTPPAGNLGRMNLPHK